MTDTLGTSLKCARATSGTHCDLHAHLPLTASLLLLQTMSSQNKVCNLSIGEKKEREKKALCRLRGGKSAARAQRVSLSRENQLCLFLPVCRCAAVRTHLYSD